MKFIFHLFQIKLSLRRSFVKSFNKDNQLFLYLAKIFQRLSDFKLSEGIFDRPETRVLIKAQELKKNYERSKKKCIEIF